MEKTAYDAPRFVVAGRFCTDEEEERLHRALREPVSVLIGIALAVLLGSFAVEAMVLSLKSEGYIASLVFPVIAACGWFLIAWVLRIRRRRIQARENARADRQSDTRCMRAGCMLSFYGDHVAYSTMRGSSILPYREITKCCETGDGIALISPNGRLFVRAADLTARELESLRTLIKDTLCPRAYRVREIAWARQTEPLPHVRFANFDEVITRGIGQEITLPWKRKELLGAVIPQMLIYSFAAGLTVKITPWLFLDCLLSALVFTAVGTALSLIAFVALQRQDRRTVRVAFTRDGVARQQNGFVTFTVNGRFRLQQRENGILIHFSTGEAVLVPWDATEEPQRLKEYFANRV